MPERIASIDEKDYNIFDSKMEIVSLHRVQRPLCCMRIHSKLSCFGDERYETI